MVHDPDNWWEHRTPTVCVDFDGVIHQHTTPWTDACDIHDPPVEGAFDYLRELIDAGFETYADL